MPDKVKLELFSLLVLFVGVAFLTFLVFRPFLPILTLAIVFAILFHTPFESLVRLFNGKRTAAALVVVALVFIFCIVPLFFLGSQIFHEAQDLYSYIRGNETGYVQVVRSSVESAVQQVYPDFSLNIGDYVAGALHYISENLGLLVTQTASVVFGTFLMLLSFFFFLREGRDMLTALTHLSPFRKEHTDAILKQSYTTIGAVLRGTILVAIARLLVFTLGFYLFGIPNAILWGSIAGIVGAIPALGTLFSVVPAVLYSYLSGDIVGSIGLALLGVLTVIFVDNFLTAYFIDKKLNIPSIFILFSILGGVIFFGPLGFVLGPLVLSLFLSVLNIYSILVFDKK